MKHNRFWVESLDKDGKEETVCHSKDEETGELYHEFLTRAKANKLLQAEQKVSPQYKYRIVRQVIEIFKTEWS